MALNPDSPAVPYAGFAPRNPDPATLPRRWREAHGRLARALAGYRALRGVAEPGDPEWIAAQLGVAEARRRCRDLVEEVESLGAV